MSIRQFLCLNILPCPSDPLKSFLSILCLTARFLLSLIDSVFIGLCLTFEQSSWPLGIQSLEEGGTDTWPGNYNPVQEEGFWNWPDDLTTKFSFGSGGDLRSFLNTPLTHIWSVGHYCCLLERYVQIRNTSSLSDTLCPASCSPCSGFRFKWFLCCHPHSSFLSIIILDTRGDCLKLRVRLYSVLGAWQV